MPVTYQFVVGDCVILLGLAWLLRLRHDNISAGIRHAIFLVYRGLRLNDGKPSDKTLHDINHHQGAEMMLTNETATPPSHPRSSILIVPARRGSMTGFVSAILAALPGQTTRQGRPLVVAVVILMLCATSGHAVVKDFGNSAGKGSTQQTVPGETAKVAATPYKDDEILVQFKPGTQENSKNQLHVKHGSRKLKEFKSHRTHLIKLKKGERIEDAVASYKADPEVESVQFNYRYEAQAIPSDPQYQLLWGMTKIDAPAAWDVTTGNSAVVVGIIDSGIDYTHPGSGGQHVGQSR